MLASPVPSTALDAASAAEPPRRVVVADASRTKRRLVRAHLAPLGYPVEEAGTLAEARALLSRPADIVVTGWLLPDGSGPDLCRAIRSGLGRAEGGYVYTLLLTGRTEGVDEGLGAGADDFVSVPVTGTELRARVLAGTRLIDAQRAAAAARATAEGALERLRAAREATDRDLAEARRLQRSLVPTDGADLGPAALRVLYEASDQVGGDLVGWFALGDGRAGLWAIDVSGHGISSALMTARLKGFLSGGDPSRNLAIGTDGPLPPAEVAARLNTLSLQEMRTELYFTLFYADLDLVRGHLSFVQAGHPPPLLLRGGEGRFLGRGGMPVGLIDDAFYTDETLDLVPGDRLVVYSDGITECEGPEGMLGEDGLRRIALSAGDDLPEALREGLRAHAAGRAPEDDISALVLDWHGP